ncbi:small, acid-soluble spore protein, alpha/beta type [Tepidanaerobacter acetatoxydans]|uniref:small, acid-soluble spore protein, alpha/beta type n=1 Tax=Tepidanaerobacter acetatoxydans TaxID=499229 RepID=UPI001BD61E77|nr:small, acid-soluble spore protein, alpha/beta type [Tepidanaerobacter acetatoxydans]
MTKKNEISNLTEKLKIEAAMELGLLEKAQLLGWDKLTAQETGKIGALVKKMLKHSLNYTTE